MLPELFIFKSDIKIFSDSRIFSYILFIFSFRFHDPAFREKITENYLNERAAARRTGMNYKERQLEDYRKWKKEQEKLN